MLKKLLNREVNGTSVYTLTHTYILLALMLCIVLMFSMAAAGISIAKEHGEITVVASMILVLSVGIAFVTLDCLSDRVSLADLLKKPFGYSWRQWGLMVSGLAVALVVGPYLCPDEDDEKNRSLRMARIGGGH